MSVRSAIFALLVVSLAACGDDASKSNDTASSTDASILETGESDVTLQPNPDTSTTPCDPVANSGCASDQMCTYVANETSPSCVTAGVVELGQPCSSEARCKKGVCLNLNDTKSLCYAVCADDLDCGTGGACLTLSNAAFEICRIDGIYENCDLLAQDCSAPTKACYAVATEAEPICRVAGTAALGAACDSAVACVRGGACVDSVCRKLCDRAAEPSECGSGYQCNEYFDGAGYCEPE